MAGIAILLAGAALAYALAKAFDVPSIPLLLVAGVVISARGVLPPRVVEDALVLGAAFLLFVTGLELNPRRTRTQRLIAVRVGAFQFVLLALAGLAAALALGMALLDSIYLGLALTASSTLVVVRLLQRRRQLFEPFARMVTGILLLQDLLVILLIPLITRLPDGPGAVAIGTAGSLLLIGLAWACHRWIGPMLLRLDDGEALLLATLAVLFVFIGIGDALGLPLVTGAFLAGVSFSAFPVNGVVRAQFGSIADFFNALFFVALGALIAIPAAAEVGAALLLSALVIVLTPPLVTLIAERYGFSARASIEAGLLLSQTSEISIVVGLYGLLAGQITPGTFKVIALVTLITMLLTPFLATDGVVWRLMRLHPLRHRAIAPVPASGHVLVLGSGTTGMPLVETLITSGNEVLVVDDDPAVIERLNEAEVPSIRGDASDFDVLRRAGADRARLISSTIRRPQDNRALLRFARGVPVIVRVFDEQDAEWVRAEGGIPVVYSEAAAEEMLKWYDQRFGARTVSVGATSADAG